MLLHTPTHQLIAVSEFPAKCQPQASVQLSVAAFQWVNVGGTAARNSLICKSDSVPQWQIQWSWVSKIRMKSTDSNCIWTQTKLFFSNSKFSKSFVSYTFTKRTQDSILTILPKESNRLSVKLIWYPTKSIFTNRLLELLENKRNAKDLLCSQP